MACEPGCTCCTPAATDAAFVVTINSEGRVEAVRTNVEVGRLRPDTWAEIPVSVTNQGYVTGPLRLRWSAVPGVEVDAPDTELTGAPNQQTRFWVRLAESGAADLTLRFWALGSLGGLANKNTAYLFLRCLADDAYPSRENVGPRKVRVGPAPFDVLAASLPAVIDAPEPPAML